MMPIISSSTAEKHSGFHSYDTEMNTAGTRREVHMGFPLPPRVEDCPALIKIIFNTLHTALL
ncbi:MAG: hypothetical protein AMK70_06715 [Nitrospira bacterium SG8_35_1]|nr:MAG: hypothetical protein AMK70_06715 [Nitrospira bacterium SG8_35_1]